MDLTRSGSRSNRGATSVIFFHLHLLTLTDREHFFGGAVIAWKVTPYLTFALRTLESGFV